MRRGSIFLETLVAAAIVALIAGALFSTLADGARHANMTRDRALALMVAQSQLAQVGHTIPLRAGETSGALGLEAIRLDWSVIMSPAALSAGAGGAGQLLRVDVRVGRPGMRRPLVALSTLRLTGARGP